MPRKSRKIYININNGRRCYMEKLMLEMLTKLNQEFGSLAFEVRSGFERIERRFEKMDARMDKQDKRMDKQDERMGRMEKDLKENLTDISEMFQGIFRKLDEKADKEDLKENNTKKAINY
jgi:hypothetical protein